MQGGSPLIRAVMRPNQVLWGAPAGATAAFVITALLAFIFLHPLALLSIIPLLALNTSLTWRNPHFSRHFMPVFLPTKASVIWKKRGVNVYLP